MRLFKRSKKNTNRQFSANPRDDYKSKDYYLRELQRIDDFLSEIEIGVKKSPKADIKQYYYVVNMYVYQRFCIGTIALTLFCAYSFHYFSFVQNMLYTTQSVIASDSVAKEIKFAGEPFKYYTNIRQEDGHTVIDMTGLQKYGNMVNCKEDLNSSIDAFENIDSSYRVEYDDTYSGVEFYCDEKGIDNHALIEIDNILYKLSLIKMLQDPTGTWSIQTKFTPILPLLRSVFG